MIDHKRKRYLYEKLFTKLLGQAAIKNTKQLNDYFFLKYGFRRDCPKKF